VLAQATDAGLGQMAIAALLGLIVPFTLLGARPELGLALAEPVADAVLAAIGFATGYITPH
jgi:hypothetical protein